MATIINNPKSGDESNSSVGMIVGLVVLLAAVGLFFIYALPAIRANMATPQDGAIDVNIKLPAGETAPAPAAPAEK